MDTNQNYLKKHAEILRKGATECAVLLKSNGDFPLDKPCKIALYGNGARETAKGGKGSGDIECLEPVSCEVSLEKSGFTVTTKAWLDEYKKTADAATAAYMFKIMQTAAAENISPIEVALREPESEPEYNIPLGGDGDVCIYVVKRVSGEFKDRSAGKGDLLLTDNEVRDIKALSQKYNKFMLVINTAGVVDLSPVMNVQNILLLSQLGAVTGDVLADILLGKAYPSGKLATTWASADDYSKLGTFGDRDDTLYREGVYVGYRYFDTADKKPLFPFGYGLGYTDFKIGSTVVHNKKSKIFVNTTVTNVGKRIGKEVVQVYVSCPQGSIDKPYQSLVGYCKTKELNAGESQTVAVEFDLSSVASYFEKSASFILEKGEYIVRIGNSSRNTDVACVIVLSEDVTTVQVKNALGKPEFVDAALCCTHTDEISGVPQLTLSKTDFVCEKPTYKVDRHIADKIKTLSDDDLAHFCIGAHYPNVQAATIGNSAVHVPGAAGETSNYVLGVTDGKYAVMADGPAGVRIATKCIITDEGKKPYMESIPEWLIKDVPPEAAEKLRERVKNLKPEDICYQYATPIPVAFALAQSFNPDLIEKCGDIVGEECEMFGIHYWLAPAMNIHRNVLCGRNFEYYSEDSVVSGLSAAAMVKGLQRHKNVNATIKHFCCNNQETNRFMSNSQVSERALREIYLKGFEICVKTAKPQAVMTSYNLLNGEHTSQRADLIDGVLRGEWGYDGIVMTDWVTTEATDNPKCKYPGVKAHKIIKAGNDIVMPGGVPDFDDIMNALKAGDITREELEVCATRIYEAILKNN